MGSFIPFASRSNSAELDQSAAQAPTEVGKVGLGQRPTSQWGLSAKIRPINFNPRSALCSPLLARGVDSKGLYPRISGGSILIRVPLFARPCWLEASIPKGPIRENPPDQSKSAFQSWLVPSFSRFPSFAGSYPPWRAFASRHSSVARIPRSTVPNGEFVHQPAAQNSRVP
jgi:hypothetical protein